eukprot:6484029-Prymnesium_polylepis.1
MHARPMRPPTHERVNCTLVGVLATEIVACGCCSAQGNAARRRRGAAGRVGRAGSEARPLQ